MKWASVFLGAVAMSWYLQVGVMTFDYTNRELRAACPGHATAWDRWPIVETVLVVVWPIDVFTTLVDNALGSPARDCERFDAQ